MLFQAALSIKFKDMFISECKASAFLWFFEQVEMIVSSLNQCCLEIHSSSPRGR